jgi:hypothetical protein
MAAASAPEEAGALLHELAGMSGNMPRYNAASQVEVRRRKAREAALKMADPGHTPVSAEDAEGWELGERGHERGSR